MKSKNHSTIKLVLILAFVSFLTACASFQSSYPNQPVVVVGSKIRLNISAEIPMEQDRFHVQNQQLISKEAVDIDRVYCSVVMHSYQEASLPKLKIMPDEFTVSRVRLYNNYVFSPVNYVNNDDNFYQPSFGVDYRTEIHLKSANQPEIKALFCTNHQLIYEPKGPYPIRAHIEATMGELVDLM